MVPIIVTILFALLCKTLSVSAVIPMNCVVSCLESANKAAPKDESCKFHRLLSKCLDGCHSDQISKQYLKIASAPCMSENEPKRCVDYEKAKQQCPTVDELILKTKGIGIDKAEVHDGNIINLCRCKKEAFDCFIGSIRQMCDDNVAQLHKQVYQSGFILSTILMNPDIDFPAECLALIGIENPSASGQVAPNCSQYVAPGQPKPGQSPVNHGNKGISPTSAAQITERTVVGVAILTALAIIVALSAFIV